MFFTCSLLTLVAIATLIFAVPLRSKIWAALTVVGLGALYTSARAIEVLLSGNTIRLWQIGETPFGMDSGSMDPLSALFVLVISLGSIAATLYSRGYLSHYLTTKSPVHISLHYTALAVMSLAMLAVVCSDGGFSFLFFWELMTIASFLLILFDAERREVCRAALSYLIMMHVGFVLLLIGFVQLHAATGSASFAALVDYFSAQPFLPLFLVFVLGFGMKAGLFPMHVWLPEAHPTAPSHVSALMSGVMIKTGIYGILRVAMALTDTSSLHVAGAILLGFGVITGLWGVMLAATQNDVKRLLAYSSIENIGVILIGMGAALLGESSGKQAMAFCGIAGALLHTVNHSFFKSLLFFGAGNILSTTHTTSLDALGGLGKHMPLTAILFLVGTVALCALPPLNGFVSELLIYLGMFDGIASGNEILPAVIGLAALALIGGVAVLAFTKLYGTVFLGSPRTHEVAEASEVDNYRIAAMALPLLGILVIGLFPQEALRVVAQVARLFLPTDLSWQLSPIMVTVCRTAWLLILVAAILWRIRTRLLHNRTVAEGPTWGCGFTATNVRMQYSGESFSEGLEAIARPLTHDSEEGAPVDKTEIFPSNHRFEIRHKDRIGQLFSAWWVEALHQINSRVMQLRTGKINHYILFALAFLGLVFVLSILNLL